MRAETNILALILSFCLGMSGTIGNIVPTRESDDLLILVNREHTISKDYEPELVLPDIPPSRPENIDSIYLRVEAAKALENLFLGASDAGYTLYAVSGYRSYATQYSIYSRKVQERGEKQAQLTSAPPGASEHQTGLAMDINGTTTLKAGLVEEFGESPEGIWVANHAHEYGFIIRYPLGKTDITGYAYEPWHLRYLGVEVATAVHELNLTYEEYYEIMQTKKLVEWGHGER